MVTDQARQHNHIMRALTLLYSPGDVVELRIPKAGRRGTISGYFDDFEALADAAMRESGQWQGIYTTLNPVEPALLARRANRLEDWAKDTTPDTHIPKRRNLLIDADPTRPAGISSTEAEHAAALEYGRALRADLSAAGWPEPIYADSGNGAHLVYRVDLPRDDGGIVERLLQAIALRWATDGIGLDLTVYNPARITKLYGTKACKGDNIPDRPHRWARILEAPAELEPVPLALLEALAGPAQERAGGLKIQRSDYGSFDLEAWMRQYAPDAQGPEPWQGNGKRWVFPECPWRPEDGATAYVVQLPEGGIGAGCQHATCPGSRATGNHWRELREAREPGCYDRAESGQLAKTGGTPGEPDWMAEAPIPGDAATAVTHAVETISLTDLLATEFAEPVWVVEDLLPAGLAFLAARPKFGKSFFALQLSLALTAGAGFLGHELIPGRALYVALEDSPKRMQKRLRDMHAEPASGLSFAWRYPALNEPAGMQALEAAITEGGLRLVVIDTLARAIRGRLDWDNLADVTAIMDVLQHLALDNDCCILLVDHHRKNNAGENNAVDDVMGSTGKVAVADTILGMYRKRGERTATLAVTGRDVEEQTVALHFDALTRTWILDGDTGEGVRAYTRQGQILRLLEDWGEGTTTELAEALDMAKGNVSRELAELVARGEVLRGERTKAGIPYSPIASTERETVYDDNTDNTDNLDNHNNADNPSGERLSRLSRLSLVDGGTPDLVAAMTLAGGRQPGDPF